MFPDGEPSGLFVSEVTIQYEAGLMLVCQACGIDGVLYVSVLPVGTL